MAIESSTKILDSISIYPPSSDENIVNYLKNVEKRNRWRLKSIISKIYNLTFCDSGLDQFYRNVSLYHAVDDSNNNILSHFGPVIGLNYSLIPNSTEGDLIVISSNSLQRFNDYRKLTQHKSTHPIAITTVSFGSIGGIGRCIFYGTQCGSLYVCSFENFEQILIANTSSYYNEEEFDITTISAVSPISVYVDYILAGNILGHLFLYKVPSMALVRVLYKQDSVFKNFCPDELTVENESPHLLQSLYQKDLNDSSQTKIDFSPLPRSSPGGVYISAMNVNFRGDLWISFGDNTLYVLSTPGFEVLHETVIEVNDCKYVATNIQFSRIHEIAVILLDNDLLMVRDISTFKCLKVILSNILTCGFPISTLLLTDTVDEYYSSRMCILIIAGMDGSLCIRRLERNNENQFALTLIRRFFSENDDGDVDCKVPISCMYFDNISDSFFLGDAKGIVRKISDFFDIHLRHTPPNPQLHQVALNSDTTDHPEEREGLPRPSCPGLCPDSIRVTESEVQ